MEDSNGNEVEKAMVGLLRRDGNSLTGSTMYLSVADLLECKLSLKLFAAP
jgi:hypothetical protein